MSLAERISFDTERNTLFINYEGFQVRTTDDVELVRREVENRCKAMGHRIAVVVNYDGFTLDPTIGDARIGPAIRARVLSSVSLTKSRRPFTRPMPSG